MYAHINKVTESIFYIGKGKGERAYSQEGRNRFWQNTVAKYGYRVEILIDGLSDMEALRIEADYIKSLELRSNGGQLVNLTYGGRGGKTINELNRDSVVSKCRESKLGSKNPNYGKKTWLYGKTLPNETREKIRAARLGQKLDPDVKQKVLEGLKKAALKSLESRTHKVRCLTTGLVWNNRHDCCIDLGIPISTFKSRITHNKEIKGYFLTLFK